MYRLRTNLRSYDLDQHPGACPFCGSGIDVGPIHAFDATGAMDCQIVYQCANKRCHCAFIAIYRADPETDVHQFVNTVPG